MNPSVFRAYDIRGVYPTELNEQDAYRIARAVWEYAKPRKVAVGRDARLSAPAIHQAVARAFLGAGCAVTDLGGISSDMAVFAAGTYDFDLVIMVTASHNPKEWIGIKLIKRGGAPIGGAGEIEEIQTIVEQGDWSLPRDLSVALGQQDILSSWIQHVLSFAETHTLKSMKVVVDAGNGVAGPIMRELAKHLPIELVEMYFEPDGNFPHHLPSPIEPENTADLCKRVVEVGANLGVAFDGDADRVFLVDEKGQRVSGSEMTAMVMDELLDQDPTRIVLYNAICGWNVRDVIAKHQATAYRTRVGHGYIKKDMRTHDGYFAGEHSGHYFFKDNFSADSGLIPVVIVLALLSKRGQKLSELLAEHRRYVSIPETNFRVISTKVSIEKLVQRYADKETDRLDGVTIQGGSWWANIRPSQTELLLRLNVEATTPEVLERVTRELTEQITVVDRVSV